jgi:hypothetical protein
MTAFSASDAALEGFQVLMRHWRVAVGWALFYVVAAVAVVVGGAILSVVLVATGALSQAGMQVVLGPLVGFLVLVVVPLVLAGGVYRLLLRPEEPAFLHLRIGPDEARLLAVAIVLALVVGLGGFVVAFLAGGVSTATSGWIGWPAAAACLLGLCLVMARLSLASAEAVAEHRIDFARVWRLGRGKSWALVGTAVITLCLVGMIGVVTWVALFVVGGLLTGFGDLGLSDAEGLAAHPGRFLFEGLAELLLTPVFIVLLNAPVAAAYKALSAEPA